MEYVSTKAIDLLYLAKQNGIEIILEEEQLQLKIPHNVNIDEGLLQLIKENKKLIIEFLSNRNWKSIKVNKNYNRINRSDRNLIERLPLSFAQERLWFIDQLEGSVQYHVPAVLRLKGALDKEALSSAFQTIIERHEVLRTIFLEEEGQSYQYIQAADGWKLTVLDGARFKQDAESLQHYTQALISRPFDLSRDYLLRAYLLELDIEEHILVVTLHHIASDAWSTPILVRELRELYSAYSENRPAQLPSLEIQYADYALWQRNYLQGEVLEHKLSYWKEKLEGVEALQLPTDYPRPAVQNTKGAFVNFNIDPTLSEQLNTFSQRQGVTLFMTLLAAYKILLYRYSGQSDISVGTSVANRSRKEVEGLIGFFVNTLALRDQLTGEQSFTEVLQQVKQTTLSAYEHQEVPFEKVVEEVVRERDLSRSPLFQVMLVLRNTPEVPRLQLGEVELTGEVIEHSTAKFELTFFLTETPQGLQGAVSYRTDLFSAASIERMIAHFNQLLHSVIEQPQLPISVLQYLTPLEQQQLLHGFNSCEVAYPKHHTLVSL
ncbi:condensation domain-containing protein, partial [Chitinophagaceae bacterium LB-8]